ncbi:hypothetical protein E2986_12017 [Frieseomelitta varia]|uniref:E3 ubiquitin-protein ligase listerin n=1 Tax=Frieseomelitta varia TaxID=561572 RepID=A0A833VQE6_9HYME|nr:hypothetical protein E2986_12017 [Frieseomelitta varia]
MLCADVYSEKITALEVVILLGHLGKAMKMVDGNIIFKNHIFLTRTLVEQDKNTIELKNFDVNTLNIKKLEEILQSTQNYTTFPYSDTYIYTIGYLLSWVIVLHMCANAHEKLLQSILKFQHLKLIFYFRDNVFTNLLNNIFRLMPMEFLQDNINKGVKLTELFSEPSLNFGESWTEWRLDHIVCWIYTNSLRYLPILIRQWWSTADSKISVAINKIKAHYVSPMLCQEQHLQNKLHDIENIEVKIHPSFCEVTALCQIDDTKLKLNITLSPNHPLEPAIVECERKWSEFEEFSHAVNKSIYDEFVLWKRSLDKKFVGVEECCICFSIFHRNTCQIPKISCHTCRKKFCLFGNTSGLTQSKTHHVQCVEKHLKHMR